MKRIVFLPGDGIGPEVANAAREVLNAAAKIRGLEVAINEFSFGGAAIDAHGDPLPDETLNACRNADGIFLGAVGGPKWDGGGPRPEAGLLRLRQELQVFANLRPL
ncbi:MAG: isocitrate/isopropylmalate family dehydrogenase, partial [Pseudomonadota bacterium]